MTMRIGTKRLLLVTKIVIVLGACVVLDLSQAQIGPLTPVGGIFGNEPIPDQTLPSGEPYAAISRGKYEFSTTDLSLPGPMPLQLTRTYRSEDTGGGGSWQIMPFGIGMNFNYDLWLSSESIQAGQGYRDIDFVYPDGQLVYCGRTNSCTQNNCTDYTDAVFQCTSNPDLVFYGSTIVYDSSIAPSGGWDLTRKDGTVYKFPKAKPVASITDRFGNSIAIAWKTTPNNSQYAPTSITDSNGQWIDFAYNNSSNSGLATSANDSAGRTVTYTYDTTFGRLKSVVDADGNTTQISYVNTGDVASITEPSGNATSISYDSSNRLSSMSAPVNSFTYAYTLNGGGTIIAVKITDPNGHIQNLSFDTNHYLTSDVRAQGLLEQQTMTYARNTSTNELITSVTDQLNRETCYTYDSLANLTSVTRLCGTQNPSAWSYSYGPHFNQLATATDPLNHETIFGFDSLENDISIEDPLNDMTTVRYNGQGQVTSITDPMSNTTSFSYDSYGDLDSVAEPLDTVMLTNDSAGRVTVVTDPLQNQAKESYDNLGNVTGMTDGNGDSTAWEYSEGVFVEAALNSAFFGITDTYSYNQSPPGITVRYSGGGSATYNFDGLGNVTSMIDGRGLTTSYTYDGLNRLTKANFNSTGVSGFNQTTATYTYDGGNRLLTAQDTGTGSAADSITRTYDGLDDLQSDQYASSILNATVSFGYDSAQRRTSMTAANQAPTSYGYDADNQLKSITQGTLAVSIQYDADGRPMNLSLPNNVAGTLGYDNDSRITSINYGSLGNLTYQYDLDGRLIDVGGTLASVVVPSPATATYQTVENINSRPLKTWNGVSATYDKNGNLLSDPSNSGAYAWNERNQMATAATVGNSLAFIYDALGRRVGQTRNGVATGYVFDGLNVVQEQTSSGNANMLSMPGSVNQTMALTIAPQLLANLSLAPGQPSGSNVPQALMGPGLNAYLVRSDSGGTWTMLRDGLGSIAAVTTGSSTRNYAYSPFGASAGSGASSSNPYQFTGSQLDASGLYYMNARYYSPVLQQFVSVDPLGVGAGNADVYAYANNSPTNMTDPLGLWSCVAGAAATTDRIGPIGSGNSIGNSIGNSQTNTNNNGAGPGNPGLGPNNNIESRVKPVFAVGPSISSPTISPVLVISQPISAQEMQEY
jgi:RHS repeat-associated protein